MGFTDGSCAIKCYNAHTKHVGTMQNYYFVTHPHDIQFEGEEEPHECMGDDQIEPVRDCETLSVNILMIKIHL